MGKPFHLFFIKLTRFYHVFKPQYIISVELREMGSFLVKL